MRRQLLGRAKAMAMRTRMVRRKVGSKGGPPILRLAALDIGTHDLRWWAPEILDRYPGGFAELHAILMERAARTLGVGVEVVKFEPRKGEYPDASEFDGAIISGCANSAIDQDPWLETFREWIRTHEGRIKLSGFSFAPQIVAVALGGDVARNPKGTELSVVDVELTDAFRAKFHTTRQTYAIHVHHNDAVLALPDGAVSLGGSPVTDTLGWFKDDSVLVFSGHPEYSYDPWILERMMLIEERDNLVPAQLIRYGLRDLYKPTDFLWQTRLQLRWFRRDFDHPPSLAASSD